MISKLQAKTQVVRFDVINQSDKYQSRLPKQVNCRCAAWSRLPSRSGKMSHWNASIASANHPAVHGGRGSHRKRD